MAHDSDNCASFVTLLCSLGETGFLQALSFLSDFRFGFEIFWSGVQHVASAALPRIGLTNGAFKFRMGHFLAFWGPAEMESGRRDGVMGQRASRSAQNPQPGPEQCPNQTLRSGHSGGSPISLFITTTITILGAPDSRGANVIFEIF